MSANRMFRQKGWIYLYADPKFFWQAVTLTDTGKTLEDFLFPKIQKAPQTGSLLLFDPDLFVGLGMAVPLQRAWGSDPVMGN